ncbi:MAG: hypothetical protein GY700_06495 [Propionibacteriaceae bacterium]|nr:hypothetical protein [Propionibacteriaceae bacterium]
MDTQRERILLELLKHGPTTLKELAWYCGYDLNIQLERVIDEGWATALKDLREHDLVETDHDKEIGILYLLAEAGRRQLEPLPAEVDR